MTFDEFRKRLRTKSSQTGIIHIDDHKKNFASFYNINKMTGLADDGLTRTTGKTTHNTLLALYFATVKKQKSMIVVMNTADRMRVVRELEQFSNQLPEAEKFKYSYDFKHNYIDVVPINAYDDYLRGTNVEHNHLFIDNAIVDGYLSFKRDPAYEATFMLNICEEFNNFILKNRKKPPTTVNGISKMSNKIITTSDGTEFKEGDLFTLSAAGHDCSSNVGTIISINYDDAKIKWATTMNVLINGELTLMTATDIEFFTKL